MTVTLPQKSHATVLTTSLHSPIIADREHRYVLAFDVGTTTLAGYLLDGHNGTLLSQVSQLNPQTDFGADVISRIQYVLEHHDTVLQDRLRSALGTLTEQAAAEAGISPQQISLATIVGNTAMHHLLLGFDPKPLTVPPYMPAEKEELELPAQGLLPIHPNGQVRILPNIAGFIGADTVACLLASNFDQQEKLTLLIDIGTNGEMVLGNRDKMLACSTAAGPAFEGAKISCGMRGCAGAIDHVWLENGTPVFHVIEESEPVGLCGSGLLDCVAVLLDTEDILPSGRMPEKEYHLPNTTVILTQQDVREVQLAKGAIRAGIELMCDHYGCTVEQIDTVYLAGAFGNYMNPASACKIGMLPPGLEHKILSIGNAAGIGAQMCALQNETFQHSKQVAAQVEFLELASLPAFQDRYVDALLFEEDEDDD